MNLAAEAARIYSQLAEANPAAHLPNLAQSLCVYASVCTNAGLKLPEALATVQTAIQIYRPLVEQLPTAFAAKLLAAHHTLADVLDALGQSEDATVLRRDLDRMYDDQDDGESGSR